jgi:D-sedoheptulose 7-phosphate isomerase
MEEIIYRYKNYLEKTLQSDVIEQVIHLSQALLEAWKNGKTIYLCGNGGSAGNAIHLANDLIYGAGKANGVGLRVEALCANPAVLTCLANDIGYEKIYSEQIKVKGVAEDILIALSGSGNSPNIINAIIEANKIGMKTFAILGYSGGQCKGLAKYPIHFEVDDMQISEDLQLIIGHMCMQWLSTQITGK